MKEIVKRILTVLVVALVMAAMLVVMTAPAFAGARHVDHQVKIYHGSDTTGPADKTVKHRHH